jgi:hypothetical protein
MHLDMASSRTAGDENPDYMLSGSILDVLINHNCPAYSPVLISAIMTLKCRSAAQNSTVI